MANFIGIIAACATMGIGTTVILMAAFPLVRICHPEAKEAPWWSLPVWMGGCFGIIFPAFIGLLELVSFVYRWASA